MPDALAARGTLLKLHDGVSTYNPLAKVINIAGPTLSLDTEDATDHDSPGGWEEVVATILRSGEVTFDIHLLPASATHGAATGLVKVLKDRLKRSFQLVFPDTAVTTWTFDAFVTAFAPAAPHEGKLTASVTLKVTGQPTLA